MNQSNMKAVSAGKINWNTAVGVASFQSPRGFCVVRADGTAISRNGSPCVWGTKKIIPEIIEGLQIGTFIDHSWIPVSVA